MNLDTKKTTKEIIKEWSDKGTILDLPNTASTKIWRQGTGPAVVCLHGVPSSAFLYRKILSELENHGLEGIAIDFPGLGFADRPSDFDYSWSGLSTWLEKAIKAISLDVFHLVVHDMGGPIGFDLIRRMPDRIISLTVLNTFVYTSKFSKPWVMRPFTVPLLGRLWVWQMKTPIIIPFFRWKGVLSGPTYSEIRAYGKILTLKDGGKAFRKIMASFETTKDFEEKILPSLKNREFPAQIIWGKHDTELSVDPFGKELKEVLNLETEIYLVKGKHFLQEDSPIKIADRIAMLVESEKDI